LFGWIGQNGKSDFGGFTNVNFERKVMKLRVGFRSTTGVDKTKIAEWFV